MHILLHNFFNPEPGSPFTKIVEPSQSLPNPILMKAGRALMNLNMIDAKAVPGIVESLDVSSRHQGAFLFRPVYSCPGRRFNLWMKENALSG